MQEQQIEIMLNIDIKPLLKEIEKDNSKDRVIHYLLKERITLQTISTNSEKTTNLIKESKIFKGLKSGMPLSKKFTLNNHIIMKENSVTPLIKLHIHQEPKNLQLHLKLTANHLS